MNPFCENCRFWDNSVFKTDHPDTGACRRHAPQADDRTGLARWPFVADYEPPRGHGLGTMRLTAVHAVADYAPGFVNDSNRHEHFNFGWRFEDPQRFEPPIPARGQQGFWKWEGGLG